MSSQITIEDLRNVVKSYSSNKPKKDIYSWMQLNAIFGGFNGLFFGSRKDYLSYYDNIKSTIENRANGVGSRRQLNVNELSYYDPSQKYVR